MNILQLYQAVSSSIIFCLERDLFLHRTYMGTLLKSSERDSLTVSALACHVADPGSNPAQGDDFFN